MNAFVLVCGNVFDGISHSLTGPAEILVKDNMIAEIGHSVERPGSELILQIKDDGRGFNPKRTFPGHLGLHSMRERMAGVGGDLEIDSSRSRGTCIRARLPLADSIDRPLKST